MVKMKRCPKCGIPQEGDVIECPECGEFNTDDVEMENAHRELSPVRRKRLDVTVGDGFRFGLGFGFGISIALLLLYIVVSVIGMPKM